MADQVIIGLFPQPNDAVPQSTLNSPRPLFPADPTGRLFDLLASFASLRSDGKLLLGEIRASLSEMRQLRNQLRQQQGPRPIENHNGQRNERMKLLGQFGLTPREVEVAMLLAQGLPNAAIASALGVSTHTARHHTQRILSKLEVHSRAAAGAKLRAD